MHLSLDKDFSPSNPYSKTLVSQLNFAGPIVESKWINITDKGEPYKQEIITKNLSKSETLQQLKEIHQNVYNKALNFNSKYITVLAISPLLFEEK